MRDRVFSVDEVNAAFKLAGLPPWLDDGTTWSARGVSAYLWSTDIGGGDIGEQRRVAALALGVLPDGWRAFDPIDLSMQSLYAHESGGIVKLGPSFLVSAVDWPSFVRGGQADVGCRLLAAHVELERLRAGGAA